MASIYWHLKNIGEIQEKANQKKVLIIKKSKKKGFFLPCPMPWGMHGELAVKSFIPGKKRKKKKYSLLLSFWESCDLVYFGKKAFFIILYQTFKKSLFIMHLIILYCYIILQYIIYIIFLFKNRIFSYVMLITCNAFYVSNFHRYCHCHLQIGYCSETVFYLIHLRYFTFKTQSPKAPRLKVIPTFSFLPSDPRVAVAASLGSATARFGACATSRQGSPAVRLLLSGRALPHSQPTPGFMLLQENLHLYTVCWFWKVCIHRGICTYSISSV